MNPLRLLAGKPRVETRGNARETLSHTKFRLITSQKPTTGYPDDGLGRFCYLLEDLQLCFFKCCKQ